jgi:uncharacterized protein
MNQVFSRQKYTTMQDDTPDSSHSFGQRDIRVRVVLLALLALLCLGMLFGELVNLVIGRVAGWPDAPTLEQIRADMPLDEVWRTRVRTGVSQFFAFLVPGWLTILLFRYSAPRMWSGVGLGRWPTWSAFGIGLVVWAVSLPLVLYTFQVNRLLPMPQMLQEAYQVAERLTKALLQMPHAGHLVANLLLIGVLPAVGEELVFRGVVQQQLMRRMAPWAAIAVSGVVFSFLHFQFDGFVPRWLLGVVLGWLYWRSGSLWVPIVVHFVNNSSQLVGQYALGDTSTLDLEQETTLHWAWAVGSVLATYACWRWLGPLLGGRASEATV